MSLPSFYHTMFLLAGLSLSGISSGHAANWSRQVTSSRGMYTLKYKLQRIVSTSVTPTGSLLAIDTPAITNGATTPNNRVDDTQGFLRQWNEVTKERKLSRLYIDESSAETVATQTLDLILASTTGEDSAPALYDQLSIIASTLIISYDDRSWRSLPTQLGEIVGQKQQAAVRIAEFDKQLRVVK